MARLTLTLSRILPLLSQWQKTNGHCLPVWLGKDAGAFKVLWNLGIRRPEWLALMLVETSLGLLCSAGMEEPRSRNIARVFRILGEGPVHSVNNA